MTERKPRVPKIKRLADGSISIDGFIAPPPKMAPPAPAKLPPYEYAENVSRLTELDKLKPVFSSSKPTLDDLLSES